jgi:hypothetical protein
LGNEHDGGIRTVDNLDTDVTPAQLDCRSHGLSLPGSAVRKIEQMAYSEAVLQ